MPCRFHLRAALSVASLLVALVVTATASAQTAPPAGGDTVSSPTQDLIDIPVPIGGGLIRTPIAVPDTYNLGSDNPDGMQDRIAEMIRFCLEAAGYFEVYGPDRYFFDANEEGMTASTINFQNWFNVGAQGLVKTSFRVAGVQVGLDFRLYDVTTSQEIDIGYPPVTVPIDRVDEEVYRFVNLVIEYYTGQPGIFGSRIAFTAQSSDNNHQIYVTTLGSGEMGRVSRAGVLNISPSWGPGGQVMYTSYPHNNADLYLGSEPFSQRPGSNFATDTGPHGEVAITSTMAGNSDIYILDSEGDLLRQCTSNGAEDLSPSWSPDGSQIAFVSDRSGGPQIFVMNADCSGQRRVTFAGNYNTEPDWSPLGDRIAFTGRDSRNRFDIFTVDPVTGSLERLTQDQGNNESPSWSPDGRYLVFASTRGGGGSRLYVMTADGESQILITPDGAGYETPAWER